MHHEITRRMFFGAASMAAFGPPRRLAAQEAAPAPSSFPRHDDDVVREMVTVAHGNLARVKELVVARPALARAGWDWGFGDWETAIDAASHVGNRPIAELLIAHGARPTICTAAMFGQLPIVKGWIESVPGVQRNRGPHGLTLLAHARAGGPAAADVVRYLEALGDADPRYTNEPLSTEEQGRLTGAYSAGVRTFTVAVSQRGGLTIQAAGGSERTLFHQGQYVFNPAGAEAVRIRFHVDDGRARRLTIADGSLVVEARV